jgi:hypothetical protein
LFLIAVIALSLITVPLAGGRLSHLADARMRWAPVIGAAIAIQIALVSFVPAHPVLFRCLHVATYALAAAFLVANRRVPGMTLIAIGASSNLITIAANGGIMAASARAMRAAGELPTANHLRNSMHLAHPRLLFLGDIFAIPKSWPFHNVFSLGDACIAIGAAITIHRLSRAPVDTSIHATGLTARCKTVARPATLPFGAARPLGQEPTERVDSASHPPRASQVRTRPRQPRRKAFAVLLVRDQGARRIEEEPVTSEPDSTGTR